MLYSLNNDPIDQWPGTLFECKLIATEYVQKIIDTLNKQFLDLPIFDATKLFSLKYYHAYEEDMTITIDVWLERLMEKFVPSEIIVMHVD